MKGRLLPYFVLHCFIQIHGKFASAQFTEKDVLFYFQNPDGSSFIGVRDAKDNIILPAKFKNLFEMESVVPIKDLNIEFASRSQNRTFDSLSPATAASEVCDTKGHLLYYPQGYENHERIDDLLFIGSQQGAQFYHCQYRRFTPKFASVGDWSSKNQPEVVATSN